jgi:phage gp29-like protein
LRGLEKYGLPMPFVGVSGILYDDDNEDKRNAKAMMESWTYDGYALFDKDAMEVTFPTASSGFDAETFKTFLEFAEKQIFRLILGQDSTSSADNSNRSTAQVHNLVRADMLASDANAVEATINNQIIKPLFEAKYGFSESIPQFRFRLKGVSEIKEMADIVKTLDEGGWEVSQDILSERLGFPVTKKEGDQNGND